MFLASIPSWLSTSNRIVGGSQATNPIPWQVLIQASSFDGHFCGGTILNETTILSARSCFLIELTGAQVVAGLLDLNQASSTSAQVIYSLATR